MSTTIVPCFTRSFLFANCLVAMAIAHLGLFANSTASGGCGVDATGANCDTICYLYDQCCLSNATNGDTGIEYCQLTCDGVVCHPACGGGQAAILGTMCKTIYNNGQCQFDSPNTTTSSSTGTNTFGNTTTTKVERYTSCGGVGLRPAPSGYLMFQVPLTNSWVVFAPMGGVTFAFSKAWPGK